VKELGHKENGSDMPSSGFARARRALSRLAEPAGQVLWIDSLEMDHLGMESANPRSMGLWDFSGADTIEATSTTAVQTPGFQEPA